MYKNDVVHMVARDTRLSQRIVGDALNSAMRVISQALKDGKTVTFPGFGTFYTAKRAEGTVRNIRTGEPITVPERRVAAFRVGNLLKAGVRNTKPASKGRK